MNELIEIREMCKIYNPGENEVRALDHVDLKIDKNEFVAIIGQSGSGKSTLMNMLGCLDVPTSGTYILNGQDVSGLTDNELSDIRNREIGFIFQGFNLIAGLTAIENVELLEDVTLGKNECMIETGNGVFDCSLGTQLEALNEELRLLSYEP